MKKMMFAATLTMMFAHTQAFAESITASADIHGTSRIHNAYFQSADELCRMAAKSTVEFRCAKAGGKAVSAVRTQVGSAKVIASDVLEGPTMVFCRVHVEATCTR